MNPLTIRPIEDAKDRLQAIAGILAESQRVLIPDYVEAGLGFDRDDWASRLEDPQTEWAFAIAPDGTPAGFTGWRYLPAMSHLHALFVAHTYQRRGYARALLAHHWRTVTERRPETQLFTLHVRQPAIWARRLYEEQGYRYYEPGDEATWPALETWIAFRQGQDRWPLSADKLLMFRVALR